MRCKKHYTDHSSTVGVCASCLRERLFCLLQSQSQSQSQTLEDNNNINSEAQNDNSASFTNNQHNCDRNLQYNLPDRRFFSTPQVAPVTGSYNPCRKKHYNVFSFSLLSNLFRSKKRNENSNARSCGGDDRVTSATSGGGYRNRVTSATSGGGYRKKQQYYCSDRGMSPVRVSDCDGVEDELYELRKQTPRRTPVVRGGGGGNGKSVSGISFCLSPLVRVSPCRNWNQKGVVPVDCGEFRSPVRFTGSYCGNRSRKVVDHGRFVMNR